MNNSGREAGLVWLSWPRWDRGGTAVGWPSLPARRTVGSRLQLWRTWPRLPCVPQPRPTLRRWLPDFWARQAAGLAPGLGPGFCGECVRPVRLLRLPSLAHVFRRHAANLGRTGLRPAGSAAGRDIRSPVHRYLADRGLVRPRLVADLRAPMSSPGGSRLPQASPGSDTKGELQLQL